LLSCVALAAAQGGGGGGGGGQGRRGGGQFGRGGGNSEMGLAMRADVQKELAVTDDQVTKLKDLQTKERQNNPFGGGNNGGTRPTQEEMQQRMAEMRATQHKDLATVLNDGQMKRLGELLLQREGASALTQADVQKSLGFSDDQVSKVKDLQTKQQEANQALRDKQQNQEITREEATAARTKNTQTMNDELLKILTADQASKFKDMQGKAFTFAPDPPRGGGGGGGGGG